MFSPRHAPISTSRLPKPIYLLGKGVAYAVVGTLLVVSVPAQQESLAAEFEAQGYNERSPHLEDMAKIQETVVIDGSHYIVPPPWAGNKIKARDRSASASFRQIPTNHTYNETKLYVHSTALEPLLALLNQARDDGVILLVESGYRSEGYQRSIFKRLLDEGRSFADIVRYVAPPGYSQHALGTAVDFHPSNWEFANTPAYEWLKKNAASFNFEETYSPTNGHNMPWEAWHWNYIGE
jgi:LAS superfamily LD-carboxypeptidase LdcB